MRRQPATVLPLCGAGPAWAGWAWCSSRSPTTEEPASSAAPGTASAGPVYHAKRTFTACTNDSISAPCQVINPIHVNSKTEDKWLMTCFSPARCEQPCRWEREREREEDVGVSDLATTPCCQSVIVVCCGHLFPPPDIFLFFCLLLLSGWSGLRGRTDA